MLLASIFLSLFIILNGGLDTSNSGDTTGESGEILGSSDALIYQNDDDSGSDKDLILVQRAGDNMFRVTNTGVGYFESGIVIGNYILNEEGAIRWTGDDFEGYDGTQWISFTDNSITNNEGNTTNNNEVTNVFNNSTELADLEGNGGKVVTVKEDESGLEYISLPESNSGSGGSTNTSSQSISLVSNILRLSGNPSSVSLAQYLDNTDSQSLTLDGLDLSISGGNTIDLSSIGAGGDFTDLGDTPTTYLGNNNNLVRVNSGATGLEFFDGSSYLDNTDSQAISLSTNTLSITGNASIVDLSAYLDNTDSQAISLITNTLSITGDAGTVDLSPYLDNTDAQQLSIASDILSITGSAPTIDLTPYLDNTDAQTLSLLGSDLTISNGNTVDLSALASGSADFLALTDTPSDYSGSALYSLRVNAAGDGVEFFDLGSTYFTQDGNSFGATAILGTNDTQELKFETDGTTQVTIDTSGNVGIGTETPGEKLDVDGNIQLSGDLLTNTTNTEDQGYSATYSNSFASAVADEFPMDIDLDDTNDYVYIAGNADGGDFFLQKMDPDLNFTWNYLFERSGSSADLNAVAVDSFQNVYIAGELWGTVDFDPSAGVQNVSGSAVCVLVKYNSSGAYVTHFIIDGTNCEIVDVEIDASDNVIIAGDFNGTADFDPDPVDVSNQSGSGVGGSDRVPFVAKYDSSLDFLWYRSSGNTFSQNIDVETDSSENIYVIERDQSLPITLRKYNSAGTVVFGNIIVSDSTNYHEAVISDDDYIYIAGEFDRTSADFDPGAGTTSIDPVGADDAYIVKYDLDGNYQWVQTFGGTLDDQIDDISIDPDGNLLVSGLYQDTVDFDPGVGDASETSNGGEDAFFAKFADDGTFISVSVFGGSNDEFIVGAHEDSDNNLFVAGSFEGTVNFDTTGGTDSQTSASGYSEFISLYSNMFIGSNIGSTTNPFANVYAGQFFGKELSITSFDLAEEYEVSDPTIGPGDVVKFDESSNNNLLVHRTSAAYESKSIGVVSTEPGLYLKDWAANKKNGRPVALAGRVPVKVSLENGPIERGDFLTTASKPGYAMKATEGGMIIGRAMESFNPGTSGDSELVKKELSEDLEVVEEILEESVSDGEISKEDSVQLEEQFNQEVVTKPSTSGYETGRIMMYVDLGYVGNEEFTKNDDTDEGFEIIDSSPETMGNYFELLQGSEGKVKLSISGDLNVEGSVTASSFKAPNGETILDLNNSSFRIYSVGGKQLLGINSQGRLELDENPESSLGSSVIPAGQTEVFVPKSGLSGRSKIFVTFLQSIPNYFVEQNAGSGFKIVLTEPSESNLNFNYLIIN